MNDIDIESLKGIANQLRIHSIAATTAAGTAQAGGPMMDPAQSYLEERLLLAFARGRQDEVGRLAPQADWARMRAQSAEALERLKNVLEAR